MLFAAVAPAHAATALASGVPVTSNTSSAAYTITTAQPYWSVVGVKPPSTADYDLVVDPGARSAAGGSTVDFVAVDTNVCAGLQRTATVNRWSGSGSYTVEFADQHEILTADSLPFPNTNPRIATLFGPGVGPATHFIGIVDIWLRAGAVVELYAAQVGGNPGNVYVMAPNQSACVRTPGQALVHGTVNQGSGHALTLRFTPTITGWYGVVQTSFGPNPQTGYSSLRIGQAP
ncbi:hypothetical protein Rhe02_52610 [Rhizocola hellebori]|uniref:Uncharacterized protein n=1 Tax=Rhizocola hellebori TaxID=1392758 RepID=A0A8J3VHA0_9ACTN|nr:hypothetical protein Rhe02_52610 [Rhizocola hellebori]